MERDANNLQVSSARECVYNCSQSENSRPITDSNDGASSSPASVSRKGGGWQEDPGGLRGVPKRKF
jgi:hypothetical protein